MVATVLFAFCLFQILLQPGSLKDIKLESCRPPDYPLLGGYGPVRRLYLPGDVIHYFCDPGTYIGGNYRRVCVDNGDWSGDTPVCDSPAVFTSMEQSSTATPSRKHEAQRASDGDRSTCTKTRGEESGATWTGILRDLAREVIRVMIFLPKGEAEYEVFIVKPDGSEVSCGQARRNIVINDWVFHNCPQPNNTNAISVKVKSLTKYPLEICELVTHTLTDPTCVDPHFEIDSGRLMLSRKTAILKCDEGYNREDASPRQLDCIRTGVWSRRKLFCEETNVAVLNSARPGSPEGPERLSDQS